MHAPAMAPCEEGCQDLKKRKSPPVKWRYGTIMIFIVELLDVEIDIDIDMIKLWKG